MTYFCGIGPGLGALSREPHIVCDGCGITKTISDRGFPPRWFLAGKAAPGWKLIRTAEETRTDYCQKCKSAHP